MNIYRFQGKGATLNHPQGMVYDIAPKFGTLVYVGMGNNVMQLRFHLAFKNHHFFHFLGARESTFCEGGASNFVKGATTQFSHKLYHI